jgi:Flp pilus assembly protein TadG
MTRQPVLCRSQALRVAQGGAIAVQMALMFVAIIGFVSLGTEVGILYFIDRQMQSAADAAALGAVMAQAKGEPSNYANEALSIAATAGFVNGQNGTVVTVASPPTTGSHAGQTGAVEVIISQPEALVLASLVNANPWTLSVHADASTSGYGACALALETSGNNAFSMGGGVTATLSSCDLAVNSSSAQAISLGGSAVLTVRNVYDVGGESIGGGAAIEASGTNETGASTTANPYASYSVPSFSGCSYNNYSIGNGNTATLSPGVYCNGMSFGGAAVVTLNPGIYYVDRGTFSVANGATVTGNNVTIVLTSSTGASYATASFGGGAISNFTALATGPTAGLAFFQDPRAPVGQSSNLANGASTTITGALYFPTQALSFSGGTSTGSACLQIVAYTITLSNGATLRSGCAGTGVLPVGSGGGASGLIE